MAHGDEKDPAGGSREQEATWAWLQRPSPQEPSAASGSLTPVTGLTSSHRTGARFTTGALLAGRFRILRFVAKGGMGEVYEAEDLELAERVAVKAIRPDLADDDRARERFRREIQLSRRVTHPNVCRIFDLFHHDEAGERVVFLTMELLEGETLAERLRREGPVATAEALPWVKQLAAGLAAAHRAGVVHRDFNPKNVILAPAGGGTRAVITDFGLAHVAREVEGAAALTASGVMVGTPAYMSPEQVEGKPPGPPADLYALGCVLFEMVTGRWPFVGDSALSTAVLRLKGRAPSPRELQPALDPSWEGAILRCLERQPEDRFASAEEVVEAIEAPRVKAHTMRLRRRTRAALRSWPVWGLVGAMTLAGGLWLARPSAPPAPVATPVAVASMLRVAVLPFDNLAGNERWAWLSTGLAEMLSTELAASRGLATVSAASVARAERELGHERAASMSSEDLQRLARNLGADRLLRGSFGVLEAQDRAQLRLDLHLLDAATGQTAFAFPVEGREDEVFALVERVGTELRRRLGTEVPSAEERPNLEALQPREPTARRLYNEALARLRAFDPAGARDRLLEAVALEPTFALAHLELANAWSLLGYERNAAEEAARARDGSNALPARSRMLVEARDLELHQQRGKAIELYRSLWQFEPTDVESGLRLVTAETEAVLGKKALATLEELRRALASDDAREDPRLDLAEAEAAISTSDFVRAKTAAARAERGAEDRGARLLLARARYLNALAEQSLGNVASARTGFEGAMQLFGALGDRAGEARVLYQLAGFEDRQGNVTRAMALYASTQDLARRLGDEKLTARIEIDLAGLDRREGRIQQARTRYESALAELRRLGAQQDEADVLTRFANLMVSQDDLEGARRAYESALVLRRQGENRAGPIPSLMNLGNLYLHLGDLTAGSAAYAEALELAREVGAKGSAAFPLAGQGQVAFLDADPETARKRFEEALVLARETENSALVSWLLNARGEVLLLAGDLADARQTFEEALALRTGRGTEAAETERSLAQLLLVEGRSAEAARGAAAAEREFLAAEQASDAAMAAGWLALAEAEEGHRVPARAAAERALAAVKGGLRRGDRLRVALAAGRAFARNGDLARARDLLAAAASEAENLGYTAIALETRIALTGVEAALDPSASSSRDRLASLAADCDRRGLGLLAARARARGY